MPTLRLDADRLRHIRISKAISQAALAKAAGLSAPSLCKIENGRQPRLSTIRALADALGVQVSDIAVLEEATA